ncbi:hypothetical protein Mapa_002631 [Marchantia paleacea]|nr:hypothetical protein Mapa_002631 [Marchantia paleacea]
MSRFAILLCFGYLLLIVSPCEGVTIRGEKVDETTELMESTTARAKGAHVRGGGHAVSQGPLKCRGIYSWCWSDWDCCTTWCNGYCYCLRNYDWCYYDYECCSGWCDRYYGCIYYYDHQPKKGAAALSSSVEGARKPVERSE